MSSDHRYPLFAADLAALLPGSDRSVGLCDLEQCLFQPIADRITSPAAQERVFAELSAGQRLLYCYFPFKGEVCNGGVGQFFCNTSGSLKDPLWEGLALVPELAEFRGRYSVELERHLAGRNELEAIKRHAQRNRDWAAFQQFCAPFRRQTGFDSWYYEHAPGIERRLLAYVVEHIEDFFRVCSDDRTGAATVFRHRQAMLGHSLLWNHLHPVMSDSYGSVVKDIDRHGSGQEPRAAVMGRLGQRIRTCPEAEFLAGLRRGDHGWETVVPGPNPLRIGYEELLLVVSDSGSPDRIAALPLPRAETEAPAAESPVMQAPAGRTGPRRSMPAQRARSSSSRAPVVIIVIVILIGLRLFLRGLAH